MGFGSLSYDLKNGLEQLESNHPDGIEAPGLHFFLPNYLFVCKDNRLLIYYHQSQVQFDLEVLSSKYNSSAIGFVGLKSKVCKSDYVDNISSIKEHIQRGIFTR